MLNKELMAHFESEKTMTDATLTVEVTLNPSEVMEELALQLAEEMKRLAPSGMKQVFDLEKEDIHKYLTTLSFMRVSHVRHSSDKTWGTYRELYSKIAVPCLAYQVLTAVGEVEDKDFSLRFIPAIALKADDLLAPDEMKAISDIMTRLERNGLKIVFGLPREDVGELGFMAMSCVQEEVRSYRKDHPVYGFLASFFKQAKLNEITGTMTRVFYGYTQDYKLRIARLI